MAVGLDVLGGLQTELYGRVELAGDSQRELTVWIIACRELFAGYNPVSYTHLDVYKRQHTHRTYT